MSNDRSYAASTGRTLRSHGPCTLFAVLLLNARMLVTVSQTGENANLIRLTSSVLSLRVITPAL
ncbi:hypothetical protein GCM10009554_12820 [Kribbella koreensis]|uniref:Uncharacterized protein n=1 Tax=Kribbella koreensis TaxID=57909 RepID=A0ABN1PLP1_9ACTN